MAPLPLVPRPLSHHSTGAVPRPRPASSVERALGRGWQRRHHAFAAGGVRAFERCGLAVDSPNAEAAFRASLEALRHHRFHTAGADPKGECRLHLIYFFRERYMLTEDAEAYVEVRGRLEESLMADGILNERHIQGRTGWPDGAVHSDG